MYAVNDGFVYDDIKNQIFCQWFFSQRKCKESSFTKQRIHLNNKMYSAIRNMKVATLQ